jgi:hypothetical protein
MKSLLFIIIFTSSLSSLYSQVSPLVSTTWNQGCYYNDSCPSDASGQCGQVYTGCYATAMAQIMKYHSWPNTGTGSSSYSAGSYGTLSVDYGSASYDWASMPNNVTSSSSEVAKIMYHAGVVNEMIYSTSSSNSFFGFTPIKKHFKYSPKAKSIGVLFMSAQEWEDAIIESLDNGMPVFAKSTSVNHFFIIDGYSTSPSLEFHFNFGWGGTYDGYYDLTNVITPAGDLTPRNAITNIKPLQGIEVTSNSGDSLNIGYNGGAISYELAAMNNWSVHYVDSWLIPDSLSGNEGWFNSSNGASAAVSSNPLGTERLGKIIYTDGSNYDTLYVTQAGNPTAGITEAIYSSTKVYPNPFNSSISITSDELINSAKIIDVNGKIIYKHARSFKNKSIDLGGLNKGIYFLIIEYDESIIQRHKLVKN